MNHNGHVQALVDAFPPPPTYSVSVYAGLDEEDLLGQCLHSLALLGYDTVQVAYMDFTISEGGYHIQLWFHSEPVRMESK